MRTTSVIAILLFCYNNGLYCRIPVLRVYVVLLGLLPDIRNYIRNCPVFVCTVPLLSRREYVWVLVYPAREMPVPIIYFWGGRMPLFVLLARPSSCNTE